MCLECKAQWEPSDIFDTDIKGWAEFLQEMAKKGISNKTNKSRYKNTKDYPHNQVKRYKGKWKTRSWERCQSTERPGKKSGTVPGAFTHILLMGNRPGDEQKAGE